MTTKNDIIAATATANGIGAISIIRVSGNGVLETLKPLIKIKHQNLNNKNNSLEPRYATLCDIFKINGEFIDEGIVIYFKAPYSFTGEDVIELQMHGGFAVSQIILDELLKLGVRLAMPGEFSKRAFLNGKIDYVKAETISAIINAKSENSVKILSKIMHGELGEYINSLRQELVKTLSYVETCIDYNEEDLPVEILSNASNMLDENSKKLIDIVDISNERKGLVEGFKVAIVGKPNVGKSSILNSLLKSNRAIISDEEGTTRDRIEENLLIGTHLIRIIDTAGIRNTDNKIEMMGIENSYQALKEADIILAVFDSSKIANDEDKNILKTIKNLDKKVFYILNKTDLEYKFDLNLDDPIKISAKNGTNLIKEKLKEYLNTQNYDGLMLTSTHQITSCSNASRHLQSAKELLLNGDWELFAFEINLAINDLSSITKPFQRTEILDEMFSNFCLGK